jgi:(E)-4-hydroxy-3-methylbut-2-enyl-diphosphate synthase
MPSEYCPSRHRTVRRLTRVVQVGDVGVGGKHPLRLQSMTTSDTEDVAATVAQCIRLAEAGCEIIRVTAPNKAAAVALKSIHREFRAAGFTQPLVADIHFLPAAAMEAVEHVEKVRVNPGNYADKKKFAVLEYTDAAYAEELERLHEAFTPLVLRAQALGRSLRIGTNHGSLSDRIMNRFGDTPHGMVESALEFIRIAESHGFKDLILSMKASNPKVMVQAYRLAAARMDELGMDYPLHSWPTVSATRSASRSPKTPGTRFRSAARSFPAPRGSPRSAPLQASASPPTRPMRSRSRAEPRPRLNFPPVAARVPPKCPA